MTRNGSKDLQPPSEYKVRHVARPLTKGEVKAAADRAEARAIKVSQTAEDRAKANPFDL